MMAPIEYTDTDTNGKLSRGGSPFGWFVPGSPPQYLLFVLHEKRSIL
jgi:hypothetical protein